MTANVFSRKMQKMSKHGWWHIITGVSHLSHMMYWCTAIQNEIQYSTIFFVQICREHALHTHIPLAHFPSPDSTTQLRHNSEVKTLSRLLPLFCIREVWACCGRRPCLRGARAIVERTQMNFSTRTRSDGIGHPCYGYEQSLRMIPSDQSLDSFVLDAPWYCG